MYRVVKFPKGYYGYKSYMELQRWNKTYKRWTFVKNALDIVYIESYCLINDIDFLSGGIIYQTKDN